MSEADKMFEELGYGIVNNNLILVYERQQEYSVKDYICFYLESKIIETQKFYCGITMQELQAINKKCEEMGWI